MTHDESIEERRFLDELGELHRAERAPDALRAKLTARLAREPLPRSRVRWALPALAAVILGGVAAGLFAGKLLEGPELRLRAEPSAAAAPSCPDYPGARDAEALLRTTDRDVLLAGLGAHALEQRTARCGALQRRYLSYVPPSLPRRSGVPVLVLLHGTRERAEDLWGLETRRRFDELASRNSFIVIYASALPRDGGTSDGSRWQIGGSAGVDDEQYLELIVADLLEREVISGKNEVYLVGHDEGADIALLAAARRPDLYAGVAALMPSLPAAPLAPPSTARLSKVLLVTEGELGLPTARQWASALRLPAAAVEAPETSALPDRVKEGEGYAGNRSLALATRDSTVAVSEMRSADARGPRVRVLTVRGAARLWPNPQADDAAVVDARGFRNRDFDAAEETWRFFSGRGQAAPAKDEAPALAPR
jgi:poly(3-hydroxybutyrate) depolymerase